MINRENLWYIKGNFTFPFPFIISKKIIIININSQSRSPGSILGGGDEEAAPGHHHDHPWRVIREGPVILPTCQEVVDDDVLDGVSGELQEEARDGELAVPHPLDVEVPEGEGVLCEVEDPVAELLDTGPEDGPVGAQVCPPGHVISASRPGSPTCAWSGGSPLLAPGSAQTPTTGRAGGRRGTRRSPWGRPGSPDGFWQLQPLLSPQKNYKAKIQLCLTQSFCYLKLSTSHSINK